MSDSLVAPRTVPCQVPLSMGFPRQEYWSGLPFLFPGGLPDPGIEPKSPALAGGFFTTEPPGKPLIDTQHCISLKCLAQWFGLHTSWNYNHSKFSEHPSSQTDTKSCDENTWDLLPWQLLYLTSSSDNYINHVVHHVPRTYVSYKWNFVPFDHLHPIRPPSSSPLVTTDPIEFLGSCLFCYPGSLATD